MNRSVVRLSLDDFNYQSFHVPDVGGTLLNIDSTLYPSYMITWRPDHWIVVARLSAGFLWVYPSKGRISDGAVRIDRGQVVIPLRTQSLTIETVSASGYFDVYAVRNLDDFNVEA